MYLRDIVLFYWTLIDVQHLSSWVTTSLCAFLWDAGDNSIKHETIIKGPLMMCAHLSCLLADSLRIQIRYQWDEQLLAAVNQ